MMMMLVIVVMMMLMMDVVNCSKHVSSLAGALSTLGRFWAAGDEGNGGRNLVYCVLSVVCGSLL